MPDNFVDFRIIKQHVSIQAVLDRYSIRLRQVNRNSLRGKCPLPTHSSKESKESFCVNTDKNIWSCMSESCTSARQGKKGGNVIDFVSVMERSSIRDAAIKLNSWFPIATSPTATASEKTKTHTHTDQLASEKRTEAGTDSEVINRPLSFTLKDIDCTHPYVRSRGLTDATAMQFGVGHFPGRGSMANRCVIPIHNELGELVAYAGRSIDASEPKYKLPNGFHKNQVVFNLHRVIDRKTIVLVEGFFDCMNVSQAGFPSVALMGCTMSAHQEKLLLDCGFAHIIVMLDGDDAGRKGADEIVLRLARKVWVKAAHVPDRKQPDEMSEDEIRNLLA